MLTLCAALCCYLPVIIGHSDVAAAQSAVESRAEQLRQRGNQAMLDARAAEALKLYREAYELAPRPALLYNLGRASLALGDYPDAEDYLVQFRSEAPSDLKSRVPGLDRMIADARKRVATVRINVNIRGAVVRIDGKLVGKTPISREIRVNAGKCALEVTASNYLTHSEQVVLPGGRETELRVSLLPEATNGILKIDSPERAAEVIVDGKLRGVVPFEVRLKAGTHQIELHKEGFDSASTSVVVLAGSQKSVNIGLEPTPKVYERWWFWTGIGLVAAGTVTVFLVKDREKEADVGTIPPGQVGAGLSF